MAILKIASKLFPNKFKPVKKNHKFSPLDANDVSLRVSRLQQILGIDKKLECKYLSDRTILIKKF